MLDALHDLLHQQRTLFRSGRSDWYIWNRFRLAASMTMARDPTPSPKRFVSPSAFANSSSVGAGIVCADVLLIVAAPLLVAPLLLDLKDLDDDLALLAEEPLALCDKRCKSSLRISTFVPSLRRHQQARWSQVSLPPSSTSSNKFP